MFKVIEKTGRMTVVESVYYQSKGGEANRTDTFRHSWNVVGEDVKYERPALADTEWRSIDTGWVKDPGTVVIYVQPKVGASLEVAIGDLLLCTVRAGFHFRLSDSPHLANLRVRAVAGQCRFTLYAYPK